MAWQDFFAAIALMLVFEGIMPFLSPERWRRIMNNALRLSDTGLRAIGLVSMLIGLALLTTVHFWLFPNG